MDEETQRRVAQNEVRYRSVNERQVEATTDFRGHDDGVVEMLCECSKAGCSEMIPLSVGEYRHVRSDPRWFLMRPDHLLPGAERPVEQHDGWIVAQKVDVGAKVAEADA